MVPTWAVMVISFSAPFDGIPRDTVPFPSYAACSAAINQIVELLESGGVPVESVSCRHTNLPSITLRPKARPDKEIKDK